MWEEIDADAERREVLNRLEDFDVPADPVKAQRGRQPANSGSRNDGFHDSNLSR